MAKKLYEQKNTNLTVVISCNQCNEEYGVDMTYSQYKRVYMVRTGYGAIAKSLLSDFPEDVRRMLCTGRCPECTKRILQVVGRGGEN